MALTRIDKDNIPMYLALSSDIVGGAIPGANAIGKTVYLTDTASWKIILDDLTLDDFVFP